MRRFTKQFYIGLLIATVVIFVLMIISAVRGGQPTFIKNAIGAAITPVENAFTAAGSGISGTYEYFKDIHDCQSENEELRERVASLERELQYQQDYSADNERLRELLDVSDIHSELDWTGARVVGRESGAWFDSYVINKGTYSGVEMGSVVMSTGGFVGYVFEVGINWAKVRAVIDAQSSVSAVCQRTGDRGVIEGDLELSDLSQCRMNYISRSANIVIGDTIETSAMGGSFPEGLIIGKIVSVEEDPQGLSMTAVVQSSVDFGKLSEVLVEVRE